MATTSENFTGITGTDTFAFTFPYIDVSEVKVTVAGVLVTPANLTISGSNVTIAPEPANGAAIVVYRETDVDTPRVAWSGVTTLLGSDLDATLLQPLYGLQESVNATTDNATGLATEITDRTSGDTTNATAIATEESARIAADQVHNAAIVQNTTWITDEGVDRVAGDLAVTTAVTTAFQAGDSTNATDISALDVRVTAAEGSSSAAVGHVEDFYVRHTSGVHAAMTASATEWMAVPHASVSIWPLLVGNGSNIATISPASKNGVLNLITTTARSSGEIEITFGAGTAGTWSGEIVLLESFGFTPDMWAAFGVYDQPNATHRATGEVEGGNISPTSIPLAEQGEHAQGSRIASPRIFFEVADGDKKELWMRHRNIYTVQQNSANNGLSAGSDLSWLLQIKFTRWA